MRKTVRDVWLKRAVLRHFVSTLLSSSYRTKSLGFLWALLDPLLFMCVYYLVFGQLVRHRPLPFILHIYIGIITFRFLNASCSQSAGILRGQGGLIREIAFPKAVLPVAVVSARLFDFAAGWLMAIVIGLAFHIYPNGYWLLIPLVIVIQTMFVTGVSFLTAYVGVFFVDIENILNVALRLWFYVSPVLFTLPEIHDQFGDRPWVYQLFLLNPMTSLLEAYESLVMGGIITDTAKHTVIVGSHLPDWEFVARAAVAAVVMLVIGVKVFRRGEGQVEKYV